MLARLPVMQPTIGPPETTLETSCDSTEPEAKRTKRSEEHNPFAVFQEVRSRRSRQPKTGGPPMPAPSAQHGLFTNQPVILKNNNKLTQ